MTEIHMDQHKLQQSIGEQILIARRRAGLSQIAASAKVGMHPVHLSKIERGVGGNTGVFTLWKISKAVGVPLSKIFDAIEE